MVKALQGSGLSFAGSPRLAGWCFRLAIRLWIRLTFCSRGFLRFRGSSEDAGVVFLQRVLDAPTDVRFHNRLRPPPVANERGRCQGQLRPRSRPSLGEVVGWQSARGLTPPLIFQNLSDLGCKAGVHSSIPIRFRSPVDKRCIIAARQRKRGALRLRSPRLRGL